MPVNKTKHEYDKYLDIWKKCRDAAEGQEVIHEQGSVYLPKLTGQTSKEYKSYVDRALYYNATQRTIDAMTGLLFRKDPNLSLPSAMDDWISNIDFNGNDLKSFAEDLAEEVITVGRYGLLVEYPNVNVVREGDELSQKDFEDNNIRPFFAKYVAESIINWRTKTVNNQSILSMVVLKEQIEEPSVNDEFDTNSQTVYRVLDLDEETGSYRQRLFLDNTLNNNFTLLSEIYPTKNGENLKFIPFFIVSANGLENDIKKPPILDLVNVNISHYRSTADLEHGAHFTALPTAVITGHSPEKDSDPKKIGAATAWILSEQDAKVSFLEFTGTGLNALEKRIDKKEQQMATLGARMLASEKASSETYETHLIKRQGENSALSSIAQSVSDAILSALTVAADWSGYGDLANMEYTINKDFIPKKMSSVDLLALLQTYQSGALPFEEFVRNLQEGEIIDSEKTPEEIRNAIDLEAPNLSLSSGGVDDGD